MAFGKDPSILKNVIPHGGSFSQQVAMATRRVKVPRSGGGGGSIFWADKYQPTEHMPGDPVRLIHGVYEIPKVADDGSVYTMSLPWCEYREHFHGYLSKSIICSAGPLYMDKARREPCYGCNIFWEDFQIRKQKGKGANSPNRVSMREMYAFTVLVMAPFHKIEQVDNQGNLRVNQKTNQPFWNWEKCSGPGCQGCAGGKETKQGHVQPWPMGRDHFFGLNAYADYIGTSCITCRSRGTVSTLLWKCGACGDPVIDMRQTSFTMAQINDVVKNLYACRKCETSAMLVEDTYCTSCTPTGQIAQRAGVFDVDMQVKRQASAGKNGTQLVVLAFSDPKPVDPAFAEMAKPLDLPAKYKPTPLEQQATLFEYQPAVPQQQTKPYTV